MIKRLRHLGVVLVSLTALMGSDECELDFNNPIDPTKETPGRLVESGEGQVWQVQWDNPVLGAYYDFCIDSPGSCGPSLGRAEYTGTEWFYDKFDIWIEVDDWAGLRRLTTSPAEAGQWQPGPTFRMPFASHGAKLAPRLTGSPNEGLLTARALHDTWNGPELVYRDALGNEEATIQLDPNVALVPVRVVHLYGPAGTRGSFSYPRTTASQFPEAFAELLLDDVWVAEKTTNTHPEPPSSPDNVVGTWLYRTDGPSSGWRVKTRNDNTGNFMQPDKVFDQCGVQFRMVDYRACEAPALARYRPMRQTGLGPNEDYCPSEIAEVGEVRAIANYVYDECGVPEDDARLMIVGGSIHDETCTRRVRGAVLRNDRRVIYLPFGGFAFFGGTTLAHELGHALGLEHRNGPGGSCPDSNVMCAINQGRYTALNADECSFVHARARDIEGTFSW